MADNIGWNLGREFLKGKLGGRDQKSLYAFLERYTMDMAKHEDDFMGDLFKGGAAPGMYQSTASGTGSATAAIDTGKVNGQIKLDAGTDDDGRTDLSLGLHFRGDQNPLVIARVSVDVITTAKVEVGFTDVVSGTDAGAVNVKATPSFTATDCAVWCLDTDDNVYWEGLGNKSGTVATTVEAAISPVAATMEYLGVALQGTTAYYMRWDANGRLTYGPTKQTSAITATVLLTPWLFVQNRSAAGHILNADWLGVYQRRTT